MAPRPRRKKPSILVSNDDGIDAPGLGALVAALKTISTVTVVAPDTQQSAVGHAITMHYPLRVRKYHKDGRFFGHAVEGTPADCVKLAIKALLEEPPDLVVSGINHGANTAVNIIYSGTVSAATEGTLLDVPSIAVSLTTYEPADFRPAARFAKRLALHVLRTGLPPGTLLNVNVPAVSGSKIRGVKITRQGNSRWDDTFDMRVDPNNRTYYWLSGKLDVLDTADDTDVIAVRKNYISVTPIQYDLTDYRALKAFRSWKLPRA